MPDVRLRLHRQAAQVDPDLAPLERDEVADLARRGVVEPQRDGGSSDRSGAGGSPGGAPAHRIGASPPAPPRRDPASSAPSTRADGPGPVPSAGADGPVGLAPSARARAPGRHPARVQTGGSSLGRELDRVPPRRAVGHRLRARRGLGVAGPVRRAHRRACGRPSRRRRCRTTAPRCRRQAPDPGRPARHASPSSRNSTFSMPVCCAQACPPTRTDPAAHVGAVARHLDPGLGLHRPLRGPAALGPVRVEVVEPRHLEVDQPLGRRHEAVETRHDHPHREAVLDGSGSPFIATASIALRSSVSASIGVPQVQPSLRGLLHRVGVRAGPPPPRAGRRCGPRSTRRCRSGRRRRGSRRSRSSPRPRSAARSSRSS